MGFDPGTRIGAYEIQSAIGAGGMGEVYRARDTRLKRDVAIKVLPEAFARDPERLARFQREAELLASLNHPNIATLFGLEKTEDVTAIVLELVEGETLADLIARGPVQLDAAAPILGQIADALEVAHEKGVVHRDLKPSNIKITPDGAVKVLDFGHAKLASPPDVVQGSSPAVPGGPEGPHDITNSPTPAVQATFAAMIPGTAAYMSPEQAKGRPVDRRSDLFSYGCVMFEMLTGKRPFEGEDVADTIACVLTKEPDWSVLPPTVPDNLRTLLRHCLEKDCKRRIADASTVRFVLDEAVTVAVAAAPAPAARPWTRWRTAAAYAAAFVLGAAVTAAAWFVAKIREQPPQVARFAIVPSPAQPLWTAQPDRGAAISPDGGSIVYRASAPNGVNIQLMARAIDRLDARVIPLPGTIGFREPIVSPDGKWVAFFTGEEFRKVSMTGGPAIAIARIAGPPRGASWGDSGAIVYAIAGVATGLMSVPAAGGEPTVLTKPDAGEGGHYFPSFLPGGGAVLFTIIGPGGQADSSQVAVLDLKTGARKILIRGGSQAEYVPSGHLVFAAAGSLRAVPFDLSRLEVVGDAVPAVEQVLTTASGEASFSVSRTGALLYVPGGTGGAQGQQFSLMTKENAAAQQASTATQASMVVVLNWGEELKRLAPRR